MRAVAVLCLSLLAASGCGPESHPVDPDLARDTLQHVLERWRDGAKPEDLRRENPSIVVQDPDWSNGLELVSFTVEGRGRALDANLHCDVVLVLRDESGEERTKTVTYLVGTDPVTTVFRKVNL